MAICQMRDELGGKAVFDVVEYCSNEDLLPNRASHVRRPSTLDHRHRHHILHRQWTTRVADTPVANWQPRFPALQSVARNHKYSADERAFDCLDTRPRRMVADRAMREQAVLVV